MKLGERKRKWFALRDAACPCGSNKKGGECCWTETRWFKAPAKIDLEATGKHGSHKRCYLRDLNTCSDKLSSEHMISASVLRVIGEDKIAISGVPWLAQGEAREIGIGSLVSNCLCEAHNSALSRLDQVAGRFYRSILDCLETDNAPIRHYLFSGHDIERWMLKTIAGLAASKNLAAGGQRLPGLFEESIDVADLLQNPSQWRTPMGMYALHKLGDNIATKDRFGVAPLVAKEGKIGGLLTQMHGIMVALLLGKRDDIKGSSLEGAPYRLEKLKANRTNGQYVIQLSWIKRHS